MKKWFTLVSLFAIFALLVACSDDSQSEGKESEDGGSDSGEEVTLTIASWSFGSEGEANLDRMMLEAFMEEHPNIKVEIDDSISDPWNESLASAASGGEMPDVYAIPHIPTGVANDWMLDVTEYVEADEDYSNLPQTVQEANEYSGTVYGIPSAQHILGYYVNKDLFNEANLDVPYLGMNIDEFTSAVRDITNVNQGVIGLNEANAIPEWYPAAASEDMGWYTFNDGFHLDSNEFISGIEVASNINTNGYAFATLSEDEQASFDGEDVNEVWMNSGIGIRWDGSWAIGVYEQNADFDWDFIGIPGDRTVITHDYYGISSATEHPEEAYELAKWMGFGKEGDMKRMEIAEQEEEVSLNGVPMLNDEEVLDVYFETVDVPGLEKAYENIESAVVEPFKTTPGYGQARWEAPTGVSVGDEGNATIGALIDASTRGDINIENYAGQINDLANQKYQEELEAIGE
ncbi:ABC transporter substrate-binding protein [Thalassobacillus devorans]|uniref:ABC transporter substrate-binding protein n=1 Tax=Thalassobacillus devorans TaxID=279813 RepID=A0ABQ1NKN8_9BACI|nr:extracellular solute-binding protein [Thalassobacillus devorans]NIK27443.1 multiple sugar transport system substrate-binding protein [Thalassobacillus devorans]GGC77735.1 ABC transporter substrate-binding protein [Thalassobacillus devorans]